MHICRIQDRGKALNFLKNLKHRYSCIWKIIFSLSTAKPLVTASSLAAFLVTALILVVVTLKGHRKSNGMRSRRDDEESRPSISASGPSPRAMMLTVSQPMSAEEETRASNYEVIQRIAPKKDEEEGV